MYADDLHLAMYNRRTELKYLKKSSGRFNADRYAEVHL